MKTTALAGIFSVVARFYPAAVQLLVLRFAIERTSAPVYRIWVVCLTLVVLAPAFDRGLGSTALGVQARSRRDRPDEQGGNTLLAVDEVQPFLGPLIRRGALIGGLVAVVGLAVTTVTDAVPIEGVEAVGFSALVGAAAALSIFAGFIEKLLLGQSRLGALAVLSLTRGTAGLGLMIGVIARWPERAVLVGAAIFATALIRLVVVGLPVGAEILGAHRGRVLADEFTEEASSFSVLQIAAVLALQADALIVATVEDGAELHSFVIWSRLFSYGTAVLSTVALPQWPIIAAERDAVRRARRVRQLRLAFMGLGALVSVAIVVLVWAVPAIVANDYEPSVSESVIWFSWGIAASWIGLVGLVLSSTRRVDVQRDVMLRAAAFNFVASIVLVNVHPLGTTVATVLSVVLFVAVPGHRAIRDLSEPPR